MKKRQPVYSVEFECSSPLCSSEWEEYATGEIPAESICEDCDHVVSYHLSSKLIKFEEKKEK